TFPANTEKVHKHYSQWAIKHGLLTKNSKLLTPDLAYASAGVLQQSKLSHLNIYADYAVLTLAVDDVLDNKWREFESVSPIFDIIISALRQKKTKKLANKTNFSFPKLEKFCDAYSDINSRLVKLTKNSSYFIESIVKHFDYLAKEFNYRKQNKTLSVPEYLELRIVTGGTETFCELAYALLGIELSKKIRNHEKYILCSECAYQTLILVNDLTSYFKEKEQAHASDNYIVMQQRCNNIDASTAVKVCIDEHNRQVLRLFELERSLLTMADFSSEEKENLQNALQILKQHLR
ncbi:unnamed protein product, partial [marine sediment metagenome]